jgi:hypothetical protein
MNTFGVLTMNSLPQDHNKVKHIVSQWVYSGGQDSATQECDMSGLPARQGKSIGFFYALMG